MNVSTITKSLNDLSPLNIAYLRRYGEAGTKQLQVVLILNISMDISLILKKSDVSMVRCLIRETWKFANQLLHWF